MTTEYRFGPGDDREFVERLLCLYGVGDIRFEAAMEMWDEREAARPCPHYEPPGTGGAGASRVKGCGCG